MKWSDFLIKPTKYSNFDISTTKRFSASYGILYPVWWRVMNPGETFSINIRNLVRTNPVKSPLMGRFKMRTVTVVSNFKNYAVGLEGYRRSFDWRNFVLPNMRFIYPSVIDNREYVYPSPADGDNASFSKLPLMAVKETSLADYLCYERNWVATAQQYGPAASGNAKNHLYKSALPFLCYYDYYRNYMVNPQEGYFPKFNTKAFRDVRKQYSYLIDSNVDVDGYYPESVVEMIPISTLDGIFDNIHKYYDGTRVLSNNSLANITNAWGYNGFIYWESDPNNYNVSEAIRLNDCSSYHGGLCATMFDPDINTQWLSVENYNRLNEVKVNTQSQSGATFTSFGDIVKASSLWDFVSREIYNGGTYADHIYSQFGVSVRSDLNIPQIVHVYDNMIDFEDITSQSDTSNGDANNPLGAKVGQQFGVGRGFGQSSRFKIRNLDNNYCIAMTFMWITPLVDYATGMNSEFDILSFSDLYTPAFDNYAMQPRLQEQYNSGLITNGGFNELNAFSELNSNGIPADYVVGYQPAYIDYKTDVNRLHGLFTNQLSYWAIVRKPQFTNPSSTNTDFPLSSYVWSARPGYFEYAKDAVNCEVPFSVTDEDNFFVQMRFDVMATRPMSKSVMPHVK